MAVKTVRRDEGIKNIFHYFYLIIIFLLAVSGVVSAEEKIKYELVLCGNIERGLPQNITTSFETGGKIYAFLYIDNIENGIHKAAFYWYNTGNNKLQESFLEDIEVTGGTYNIYSWLLLKDSHVLFDTSFIGQWKVEVYIDDKFLTEQYFTVN